MYKDIFYWLLGILIIFAVWFLGSLIFSEYTIPSPFRVFSSLVENREIHFSNFSQSGKEAFFGIILATIFTFFVVALIGILPKIEQFIYPIIVLIKSTPAVAFVPIFIVLFGTGLITKILVAFMICLFPLIVGTIDGLKRTPDRLVNMAKIYGSTDINIFLNIRIGYAINGFCSGLKTASPLSVIGAIVGEYVAGNNDAGLGAFIMANVVGSIKINLFAGAILSTLLGLIFFLTSTFIYNLYEQKLHVKLQS
jgi:NitT/TauT family transport system permease protein